MPQHLARALTVSNMFALGFIQALKKGALPPTTHIYKDNGLKKQIGSVCRVLN